MKNKKKLLILVMVLMAVIAIMGWRYMEKQKERADKMVLIDSSEIYHDISVIYINAGKADSILVTCDGHSYLIDTGLSDSVPIIQKVLTKYQVEQLQGVFITHTHKDHLGGLKKLCNLYTIENLYSADISMKSKKGNNPVEKAAGKNGLELKKLSAGDRVEIAEQLYFEVLAPLVYNNEDDNDNSLVLRLYVNDRVFLFTGDMQFAEERTLLKSGIDLSADILKVGNHGNPDATSEEFARAVVPEVAVITTDTSKDEDSANERVRKLFGKVYITQDYEYGVKVTVDKKGIISVADA